MTPSKYTCTVNAFLIHFNGYFLLAPLCAMTYLFRFLKHKFFNVMFFSSFVKHSTDKSKPLLESHNLFTDSPLVFLPVIHKFHLVGTWAAEQPYRDS